MGLISSLISGAFDTAISAGNLVAQKKENEKSRDFSIQQQEDAQAFNAAEAQKSRDFSAQQQEDAQAFNSAMQEDAQAFNSAMQEDAQAFNASEAALNRDFQSKEAEAAFEREREFYEQYQSVGAQVRQYQEAGLNPALLAGGVSVGSTPSSPSAAGSAASSGASSSGASSSSAIAAGAASSSPIAAAMSALPEIAMIGKHLAEIANIKADTKQKEESTKKTTQEILTEQQNTEVARATAADIGTRTKLAVDRWSKESLKIDEEINLISKQAETETAKKEELIAEKILKETMESYQKWQRDTAALRYWTSTGFYALSSGLANLVNAGVNIFNVKSLIKSRLKAELKLPTDEVNLPNNVHKSEEMEFFDSISEILDGM